MRYLDEGNYEEAIIAFNAAIEIDPKQPMAYVGLADVYISQGEFDKAMEILQDALEKTNNADSIINKITELEAESIVITKNGITLSIKPTNERLAIISVSGISLKDSYITNLDKNEEMDAEYIWGVSMHSSSYSYDVSTRSWKYLMSGEEDNNEWPIKNMQHSIWYEDESGGHHIKDTTMEYTANSITWQFDLPEEYEFSFENLDYCNVEIFNDAEDYYALERFDL